MATNQIGEVDEVEQIDCDRWDSVTVEGDHTQVAETAAILAEAGKRVVIDDGELNCSTTLDAGAEYNVRHYDNGHSVIQEEGTRLTDARVDDGDTLYVNE